LTNNSEENMFRTSLPCDSSAGAVRTLTASKGSCITTAARPRARKPMTPLTLSGAIVESLKTRNKCELSKCPLDPQPYGALRRDETEYWDYKRELYLDTPTKIKRLAKDVLAFHNTKGDVIIVGVDDDYYVPGIARAHVLDTYVIQENCESILARMCHCFRM